MASSTAPHESGQLNRPASRGDFGTERSIGRFARLPSGMAGTEELSPLQTQILRALSKTRDIKDLAHEAKVSPAALGREIARLQLSGLIGEDGRITRKGLDAIRTP